MDAVTERFAKLLAEDIDADKQVIVAKVKFYSLSTHAALT